MPASTRELFAAIANFVSGEVSFSHAHLLFACAGQLFVDSLLSPVPSQASIEIWWETEHVLTR